VSGIVGTREAQKHPRRLTHYITIIQIKQYLNKKERKRENMFCYFIEYYTAPLIDFLFI